MKQNYIFGTFKRLKLGLNANKKAVFNVNVLRNKKNGKNENSFRTFNFLFNFLTISINIKIITVNSMTKQFFRQMTKNKK